jgi:hypothetical protein
VSCTKIIPDLNLAEGKISAPGSEPKTQTFSSASLICFTDKRNHFLDGDIGSTSHGLLHLKFFLTIQGTEDAKKRYFSFAVERSAKEKDQSLRDIILLQMPTGLASYCFPSTQRKTIK